MLILVDKKNYVLSTYAAKSLCSSCVQQGLLCAASYTSDGAKELDQLSKAKSVGVLDLSPEDEVEGEIIYLQARLLDNAVLIKHNCGRASYNL